MKPLTKIAVLLAALLLAACSLPRGAAVQSEILKESRAETPTFQVVPVTRANVPALQQWPRTGWHGHFHWPNGSNGSAASVIRTGDMLNVTIWDSQENSLITSAGERFTTIDGVEVDTNGSVFLPYVNKIGVRGLTVAGARSKIQSRLEPIVPSAQVQVSLEQGRDHSVDVVGGVANPGAYPMPSRNYKIRPTCATRACGCCAAPRPTKSRPRNCSAPAPRTRCSTPATR